MRSVPGGHQHWLRWVGRRCLFGRELEVAQRALATTQWQPRPRIAEMQWQQVQTCVAYAREASEFYRRRLEACGAADAITPGLFLRLPPLTRDDVISSWATIRTAHRSAGIIRRRSGGSSGRSIQIPLDRATYCWYVAGTWRGLQWWGTDYTGRGAVILGSGATGLRRAAVRARDWVTDWQRFPVTPRFDQEAPQVLDRIGRFGPAFLYGYPSAVDRLAGVIKAREGRSPRTLKVIVLTGEPLYAFQRQSIEQAFQCPVAEEYGSGELGCMAFQCPERTLHITAESVFLEIAPAEPALNGGGERILATHLRNRRFPLIRYETGDVGAIGGDPCRCGRGLPALRLLGRLDDRLVGRRGPELAQPCAETFFSALPAPLRGRVQIMHQRPGHIEFRVERGDEQSGDLRRVMALGAEVFGTGWVLEAVAVYRFARLPSGKLPYFVQPKHAG